jgi:hypothetical protein
MRRDDNDGKLDGNEKEDEEYNSVKLVYCTDI